MEVCNPEDTRIVGCAIDIGTTTVAMVLTDLVSGELLAKGSSGNGQIRYGADVINRIIEQSKPGGRKRLQDAVVKETLTPIIANLCKTAHINARSILRMSVGANTTMNHLLVGVDANPVRIDNFIRAKGAIFSAIDTLLKSVDMTPECIDRVYVAGGIGSGINMKNAVNIGMFPDVELEKFQYILL